MLRFLKPHYVLNTLLCLSYFWVRTLFPRSSLRSDSSFAMLSMTREQEISAMIGIILVMKVRKSINFDAFLGSLFLFSKTLVLTLVTFMSYKLTLIYAVGILVLYFVFPRPTYDGPQNITVLNKLTFDSEVLRGDPKNYWLVNFGASWCPDSANFERIFASLSLKYSAKHLKFGYIDVAKWPEYAEKYKIDASGTSWQIPTLIMFKNGIEEIRAPKLDHLGKVQKVRIAEEKGIIKYFQLERHYLKAKSS
eukprot:TRINITY_DN780184_c0_g1_i1.p1 TRINITY_DN780184_c0_g1~~TRINITY_DN780184_c0_g1_i1.p1  ORF type:complete len:250 (+),score=34.48 TRINITY_DN780184_c0_g1_i1:69-818(+)